MRPIKERLASVLFLVLVVATTPGAAGQPLAALAATDLPRFEFTDCDFGPQRPRSAECGVLTVRETRDGGGDRRVALPVVIFRSGDETRLDDPVVYVSGRPGYANIFSPLHLLDSWLEWLASAVWLSGRDLIVFDPRGTGMAQPSLDCPEEKSKRDSYPLFELPYALHQACADKLRNAGIDLSAYRTSDLAADVNDLRRALGIKSWNIWAQSHGTRVALEAMRQDDTGIRSVILEGVHVPELEDPVTLTRNFDRILSDLIANCQLHDLCASWAPDLSVIFEDLLKDFRRNPRKLKTLSQLSFSPHEYEVDDGTLLRLLFSLLQHRRGLYMLPFVVIIAHQGRLDFTPIPLSDIIGNSRYQSMGATAIITCNDGRAFDHRRLEQAVAAVPRLASWTRRFWRDDHCKAWTARRKPVLDPGPLESNLPVLLLAGAYDPTLPAEWAHDTAKHLLNSHLFIFPGETQIVSRNRCAMKIMLRFLESPVRRPSDSCFTLERGPRSLR